MRTRGRVLALTLVVALLTAGCWDFRGLDQRAFIVMAGIDRLDDGRFRLTLQLPTATPRGDRATAGGGGGPAWRVVSGEGEGIREALEQARASLFRELDLTFLDTIVVGRSAAADLWELDQVVRSFRIPVTSFMGVARESAESIIRADTPSGVPIPEEYTLRGFSGAFTRSPAVVPTPMWAMFNRNLYAPLEDPYAPAMTAQKYGVNWDGLAVFRGPALAGFLDADAAALFGFLHGGRLQFTVAAPLAEGSGARAALFVQRGKVRRWAAWEGNVPVLHIDATVTGDLRELVGVRITDRQSQAKVEAALAQRLAQQITSLVRRLQDLGSDPMGFGERARRASPYRAEVQSGAAWHAVYPRARVEVSTRAKVVSTGYLR